MPSDMITRSSTQNMRLSIKVTKLTMSGHQEPKTVGIHTIPK
jgi:hypothetical protein